MRSRTLVLGTSACLALLSVGATTFATPSVHWYTTGVRYDRGYRPAVATNGLGYGNTISQHLGADGNAELWYNPGSWLSGFQSGHYTGYPSYQVGPANPGGVNWQTLAGDSTTKSNQFFTAFEYNQDQNEGFWAPYLYFIGGTWNSSTGAVTWVPWSYEGEFYGDFGVMEGQCGFMGGYKPSIAMATVNGTQYAAMVYNGYVVTSGTCTANESSGAVFNRGPDMWLQVGPVVSEYEIGYSNDANPLPTSGNSPSLAMWPISSGPWAGYLGIIEVHQDEGGEDFTSTSGRINPSTFDVIWDIPQHYDYSAMGNVPRVAYCGANSPYVIEVHNGGDGSGWYHLGQVGSDGYSVTWLQPGVKYASPGSLYEDPSVSCNGEYGVESHADPSANITASEFFLY